MIRHTLLTAATLLAISSFSIQAADPVKSEVDGTWDLISFNENGKENEVTVQERFVTVRMNGVQTISKGDMQLSINRFILDTKATPKTITFIDIEKNESSTTGIYTVDKNTMKIAILSDKKKNTKERPKDFELAAGKTIVTYRKTK